MHNLPLVSVAAINYNNARYLVETLDSIAAQTYPNVELVIVDDCSTDNSVELIEKWLVNYKGRHKFIKHEVNKGVCKACNSGLSNATGKYFSIIATDDVVVPEKIAVQVNILESTSADVAGVYSDAYLIDENSAPLPGVFIDNHRKFNERPRGSIYETLLQGNYIPGMTFLFKKSVFDDVGYYDETLAYEDYDMWLRISKKYQILFSEFKACKYRIRRGSLSETIRNWNLSDARIFVKHTDAALPLPRIRKIALDAYSGGDNDTMDVITRIATDTSDKMLLTTCMLWDFKVPVPVGLEVITMLGDQKQLTAPIVTSTQPDSYFAVLEHTELRAIAQMLYRSGDDTEQLLQAIAAHTGDPFLIAAWMLHKYKIKDDTADALLSLATNSTIPRHPLLMGKDDDAAVFVSKLLPLMPIDLARRIIATAYLQQNEGIIQMAQKIYTATGDLYFRTIALLIRHKIRVPVGAIISERIAGYCDAGKNKIFIVLCMYKDVLEARYRYNKQ